jgi:hypothetical protein
MDVKGKSRIHKIDETLAKEEQKQLKSIYKDIKSLLKNKLKKIAPGVKIKWHINEGTFSDWEEQKSKFGNYFVRLYAQDAPWIEWDLVPPGKEEGFDSKYGGSGSITFHPQSLYPEDPHKMEFTIGDSEWGIKLKNKGLYSAIFSALGRARDKGWLGDKMHVHMGLGTKAWGKLARKFNFDWYGLHPKEWKTW